MTEKTDEEQIYDRLDKIQRTIKSDFISKQSLLAKLPKKEYSHATENYSLYESEWDEGFNDCLKQVIEAIERS